MHTWFECKVRYERPAEDGASRKVAEAYLVDALSFTEAEARIIEELAPFAGEGLSVTDIKRAKYEELFASNADADDRWFKIKICFITLDAKGEEKRVGAQMLVQASDLRRALVRFDEAMKGTMADYEISSVAETAIMDVITLQVEDELTPAQAPA